MKYITAILFTIIIVLGIILYFTNEKKNDLEVDLSHLENTVDITVDKRVNDAKRHVTDSLLKKFNSRPHDTIIKTKIKYRYEKITDTILVYPTARQLMYITRELNRLYPDN